MSAFTKRRAVTAAALAFPAVCLVGLSSAVAAPDHDYVGGSWSGASVARGYLDYQAGQDETRFFFDLEPVRGNVLTQDGLPVWADLVTELQFGEAQVSAENIARVNYLLSTVGVLPVTAPVPGGSVDRPDPTPVPTPTGELLNVADAIVHYLQGGDGAPAGEYDEDDIRVGDYPTLGEIFNPAVNYDIVNRLIAEAGDVVAGTPSVAFFFQENEGRVTISPRYESVSGDLLDGPFPVELTGAVFDQNGNGIADVGEDSTLSVQFGEQVAIAPVGSGEVTATADIDYWPSTLLYTGEALLGSLGHTEDTVPLLIAGTGGTNSTADEGPQGSFVPIEEPEPTATSITQPATDPEPTVEEPEPTAAEPEPTVEEPEPTVTEPEPTAAEPEPTVREPEPTVTEPEPTVTEPEPTETAIVSPIVPSAEEPVPTATQPTQVAEPVASPSVPSNALIKTDAGLGLFAVIAGALVSTGGAAAAFLLRRRQA